LLPTGLAIPNWIGIRTESPVKAYVEGMARTCLASKNNIGEGFASLPFTLSKEKGYLDLAIFNRKIKTTLASASPKAMLE
jgi:hypothetical protein